MACKHMDDGTRRSMAHVRRFTHQSPRIVCRSEPHMPQCVMDTSTSSSPGVYHQSLFPIRCVRHILSGRIQPDENRSSGGYRESHTLLACCSCVCVRFHTHAHSHFVCLYSPTPTPLKTRAIFVAHDARGHSQHMVWAGAGARANAMTSC